jgi:hypothetical protein
MTEIDEPRITPTEDFPFQVFLKQIADQITDEEVKSLKFLNGIQDKRNKWYAKKWHSEMCRYNCSGLDYE